MAALQLMDRSWQEMSTIRLPEDSGAEEDAEVVVEEDSDGCELSALLHGGWPGDAQVVVGASVVSLHRAVIQGAPFPELREIESGVVSGSPALFHAASWAYGCEGRASRVALRAALLEACETGAAADAKVGGIPAHKAILAVRSEYFAAVFKRGDVVVAVEQQTDRDVIRKILRYAYTLHREELEALVEAVFVPDETHAEPRPVRAAYALDQLLLVEARDAVVERLAVDVDVATAAPLLAVATRLGSGRLTRACLTLLTSRTGLEDAKRADPVLFDDLVPPDLRRTIDVLRRMADTNPVGRGQLTDAREAIGMLREALDMQLDRLAAAELRRDQLRRRGEDDASVRSLLDARRLRLDYLHDYVETHEALLFGKKEINPSPAAAVADDDWCYEWRPISQNSIPPGLDVRLVFDGSRSARIPPVWTLKLYFPAPSTAVFRRKVGQTTTVADVLADVLAEMNLQHPGFLATSNAIPVLVDRGNQVLTADRNFDPILWKHRDALTLQWRPYFQ
ncbi:hypothetical protein CTAYLR_002906 [Chrysophaeum taylorii]|uniref:BTB domain-containing protein n=1 Tax=Chrysophaeum taylorii TaxID=2483200 RepID=A0AAD7XR28_9STRA|nr:hypothetical protein CTAYLR_002906 [Chrysophaeum taylorii]